MPPTAKAAVRIPAPTISYLAVFKDPPEPQAPAQGLFSFSCAKGTGSDAESFNIWIVSHEDYLSFNSHPYVESEYTNVNAALSMATVKSAALPIIFKELRPTVILFVSAVPA